MIWTVGHSTRTIEEFLEILTTQGIRALADVRRFPASRKYPQFSQEEMKLQHGRAGIDYIWLSELGGRRPARLDSHNTVWRNPSFRGYVDFIVRLSRIENR
jgi:uncharacterized protein (DUF488 family)